MADTLRIGGMKWANVPFFVVDIQTGDARIDSIGTLLPPVIGLPIMLRMKEVRLDFEHRQFIIPATPSPNPLSEKACVLSPRTKTDSLFISISTRAGIIPHSSRIGITDTSTRY